MRQSAASDFSPKAWNNRSSQDPTTHHQHYYFRQILVETHLVKIGAKRISMLVYLFKMANPAILGARERHPGPSCINMQPQTRILPYFQP